MVQKDTYAKQAERQCCNISLLDLDVCKKGFPFITNADQISPEVYQSLVLYSPSSESNLGKKIPRELVPYSNDLLGEVLQRLDLKQCYLFSSYKSECNKKSDISHTVKTQSDTFLLLYSHNGILESLFTSIRNALAHGNILKYRNHYYLYALSRREGDQSDQERKLSFLLKIYSLDKLNAYYDVFNEYSNTISEMRGKKR